MLITHAHVHITHSEDEKIIILINREKHTHNDNILFLFTLLLYSEHILVCTAHQINQTLVAFRNAFGDHKSLNLGRERQ